MSNDPLQKDSETSRYSDECLYADKSLNVQALILGAYIEERRKWETKLAHVSKVLGDKLEEESKLKKLITKQSKIKLYFCALLNIKTKLEKRFSELNDEIIKVEEELANISNTVPLQDAYDLAILGNNLFVAR